MSRKKRIGRPPIAKKLHKASLLSVRFSAEEKRSLDRAAQLADTSLSEWARRALLAAASFAPSEPREPQQAPTS